MAFASKTVYEQNGLSINFFTIICCAIRILDKVGELLML